ncbi:1496_t:CDS:2 [Diversispora eburnea]|uniref:1496_t:CDS:1 n=1 Tax=Diversispora eburnea TaxID=1213867 RepID=A0A9N8Z1D9_9GLOM|nr:1496_t:CDS:2 [Diversispora eburnea]
MPYIQWLNTYFGLCIHNDEAISFFLGCISIFCWLNAQFPSADGLSLPFLLTWLLGDLTNLIGCILTKRLAFQYYLAEYFCAVDFGLFFQYFYYTWYKKPVVEDEDLEFIFNESNNEMATNGGRPLSTLSLKDSILEGAKKNYTFPARKKESYQRVTTIFAIFLFAFHTTSTISSSSISSVSKNEDNNNNEFTLFLEENRDTIGKIMAWSCTFLYLTSRMPQIWKNYTRRSVEGLSIFMFIFAALGNLSYTLSIFTHPLAKTSQEYLYEQIPYVLGSIGTLAFDVTIFLQWYEEFITYRDSINLRDSKVFNLSDDDGSIA